MAKVAAGCRPKKLALVSALLFVLVGLATPGVPAQTVSSTGGPSGSWPMYRFGPTHTGVNPFEHQLSVSSAPRLRQRWAAALGGQVESSPAVVNGTVFVGSGDGRLYAIDARTGRVRWAAVTGASIASSPAVSSGIVYVGSEDSYVYAFDAATGALNWKVPSARGGFFSASPVVVDGVVYVAPLFGDVLEALDAQTGALRWTNYINTTYNDSSPAVADGLVFICTDGLYAFDAATGAVKWAQPGLICQNSVAIANATVYVGAYTHVDAYDEMTGAFRWSSAPIGAIDLSSPAVDEGAVYVGSDDGNLYAFDPTTGTPLWSASTGSSVHESSPAVANGVVVIGATDDRVHAYDTHSGRLLWSSKTGGWVYSSPALWQGHVFVGSQDGHLYAYGL